MRFLIASCLLMLAASSLVCAQGPGFYGHFEGELILKPLARTNQMELLRDYAYIDPAGGRWDAPAGTISDGATIPRLLWTVAGEPWGADYRNAAVIHDVACKRKNRPWEMVHLTFYYAMLAAGVGEFKANMMYQGVLRFGPKWGVLTLAPLKGQAQTRRYDEPTRKMTQEDYAQIQHNAKLVSEIQGLSPPQRAAALQESGQLNLKRIETVAKSDKPWLIYRQMPPRDPQALERFKPRQDVRTTLERNDQDDVLKHSNREDTLERPSSMRMSELKNLDKSLSRKALKSRDDELEQKMSIPIEQDRMKQMQKDMQMKRYQNRQ